MASNRPTSPSTQHRQPLPTHARTHTRTKKQMVGTVMIAYVIIMQGQSGPTRHWKGNMPSLRPQIRMLRPT
jgi:hypothetical protein